VHNLAEMGLISDGLHYVLALESDQALKSLIVGGRWMGRAAPTGRWSGAAALTWTSCWPPCWAASGAGRRSP